MKAITTSMRAVMGGPTGQQRLEEIVDNVRGDHRATCGADRREPRERRRHASEHARDHRAAAYGDPAAGGDSIDRVAKQIGGTVGENRPDVREVVQNLRGLSADLRVTADNLNAITGQVKSGEGTMGKLFYSDEAHDRLTGALSSVEGGVK